MPTYTLSYDDGDRGGDQTIQFEALDPAAALHLAQRVKEGLVGVLAQDGKPLCRLERRPVGRSDIWVVAPADPNTRTQPPH